MKAPAIVTLARYMEAVSHAIITKTAAEFSLRFGYCPEDKDGGSSSWARFVGVKLTRDLRAEAGRLIYGPPVPDPRPLEWSQGDLFSQSEAA